MSWRRKREKKISLLIDSQIGSLSSVYRDRLSSINKAMQKRAKLNFIFHFFKGLALKEPKSAYLSPISVHFDRARFIINFCAHFSFVFCFKIDWSREKNMRFQSQQLKTRKQTLFLWLGQMKIRVFAFGKPTKTKTSVCV